MAGGFDDFIRGFSEQNPLKGVVSQLDQENKNKLELAMLSKRIEMEQKALQGQAMFQNQLNTLTPEETQGLNKQTTNIFNSLQNNTAPQIDFSGLGRPQALGPASKLVDIAAQGLAKGTTGDIRTVTNPDGSTSLFRVNKKGQPVAVKIEGANGVTTDTAKKTTEARAGYYEASDILNDIRKTLLPHLALTAAHLPQQYATLTLNQLAQYNPDVKAYFDSMPATTQRLGFALTHAIGADRSPAFLEKQAKELPQMSDTLPTAEAKLKRMNGMFRNMVTSEFKARNIPLPSDVSEQQQSSNGMPSQEAIQQEIARRKALRGK